MRVHNRAATKMEAKMVSTTMMTMYSVDWSRVSSMAHGSRIVKIQSQKHSKICWGQAAGAHK